MQLSVDSWIFVQLLFGPVCSKELSMESVVNAHRFSLFLWKDFLIGNTAPFMVGFGIGTSVFYGKYLETQSHLLVDIRIQETPDSSGLRQLT